MKPTGASRRSTGRISWGLRSPCAQQGVACDEPRAFLHGILSSILLRDEGGRRVYGDPARVDTGELCATLERIRDVRRRRRRRASPGVRGRSRRLPGRRPRAARDDPARAPGLRRSAAVARRAIVVAILDRLGAIAEPSVDDVADALADAYGASRQGAAHGYHPHLRRRRLGQGGCALLDARVGLRRLPRRRADEQHARRAGRDRARAPRAGDAPADHADADARPRDGRARLVLGSAGSVRLAGAIAQVAWQVVGRSLPVADAIDAPRLHVGRARRCTSRAAGPRRRSPVSSESWDVVRWSGRNLYFGGVQAVEGGRRDPRGGRRPAAGRRRSGRRVIRVRRAEPSDAASLVELAQAVGGEEGRWILATESWRSVSGERRYLKTVLRHPDAAVIVATDGDHDRRTALPVSRPASRKPPRRRSRADGRREPPPAGDRDEAARRGRRLGADGRVCESSSCTSFPGTSPRCTCTRRSASSARATGSSTTLAATSSSTRS